MIEFLGNVDYYLNLGSRDYLRETVGWTRLADGARHKFLPYAPGGQYRQDTLDSLQGLGNFLYQNCDTVYSITEKMLSYVISDGIFYQVRKREHRLPGPAGGRLQTLDRLQAELERVVDTCYPESADGWVGMQTEGYRRYLRSGEYLRRKFLQNKSISVRFMEPFNVYNPTGKDDKGAILGVIRKSGDDTEVSAYWQWSPRFDVHSDPRNWMEVSADRVDHLKHGVDAADPRGVPPFWKALCHAQGIRSSWYAMDALAVVRSAYAVIRKHQAANTYLAMKEIATAHRDHEEETSAGAPVAGREFDSKGFEYEFPEMNLGSADYLEIIMGHQRHLGNVFDMPEWMATGKIAGGGRGGVVQSEGPFDRRIIRERSMVARQDKRLLWRGIATQLGWAESQLAAHQRAYEIVATFPPLPSRDKHKDSNRIIAEVRSGLNSVQGGTEELGRDYDQVQQEITQHNEAHPDRKIVPSWNPETKIQRNSGDNPRPNRPPSQ